MLFLALFRFYFAYIFYFWVCLIQLLQKNRIISKDYLVQAIYFLPFYLIGGPFGQLFLLNIENLMASCYSCYEGFKEIGKDLIGIGAYSFEVLSGLSLLLLFLEVRNTRNRGASSLWWYSAARDRRLIKSEIFLYSSFYIENVCEIGSDKQLWDYVFENQCDGFYLSKILWIYIVQSRWAKVVNWIKYSFYSKYSISKSTLYLKLLQ